MSFWPFPTTLHAELHAAARRGPVVEIGAGDGALCARLRTIGLDPYGLDLRRPSRPRADRAIIGDARALPFGTRTLGGCVIADVLRHFDPGTRARVASECARVVVGAGRVIVLEDVPAARDDAEQNYRRALALLAEVDRTRGPVQDIDDLTAELRARLGEPIAAEECDNEEAIEDPLRPVRWMRARDVAPRAGFARDLDALEAAIGRHGMRIGRYAHRVFAAPVVGGRAA